jgi:hypothetical protein
MKGVLAAMRFERLGLLAVLSVPAGVIVLAAGLAFGQGSEPVVSHSSTRLSQRTVQQAVVVRERWRNQLALLVALAQARFETSKTMFAEGSIGVDRMIDASERLEEARRISAAGDVAKMVEASTRHLEFLKSLEDLARARRRVSVSQAPPTEFLEIRQARLMAELTLERPEATAATPREAILEARVKSLESRLDEIIKRLDARPR